MVIIDFLGPISRDSIELDIYNLKDLANFMDSNDELREWIDISAIAVNDKIVTNKDFVLKDGDRVSILPPVCGG
jgi:molybdopterin synthase sulfur carrier subunit